MKYEVERCPHCGSHRVQAQMMDRLGFNDNPKNMVKCHSCGFCVFGYDTEEEAIRAWNDEALKKKDKAEKNPYTAFAKEMSLLHEALKAEGFKDAMVDILAKMAPILWDRCAHLEYVKENEAKKNRDLFIVPGEEPIKFGIRVGAYGSGKEKENEGNR